jgi:tripartite-type tricarboxylate transporter receptor subunit TctC
MKLMARAAALAAGILLVWQGGAFAQPGSKQAWPDKSVRIVVAFGAGGTLDTLARIVSSKLSEMWGQQVVVENRAGAGGNIGASQASQATPDGYTLHFGAQTLAVNMTLAPNSAADPNKSFDPIILIGTSQEVLQVSNSSPWKSVKDLIDDAKANPGKLNYGSVGVGSTAHLATALFSDVTGIQMQHVPYSQMAQGQTDLISGRTPIWFGPMGSSLPNIRANKARALAVTGPRRAKLLPEIPTMSELGIKMGEESSWYGFFAPKGTPKAIIEKINRDLQKVIDSPDMREREVQLGYRFIGGPPEKLGVWVNTEIAKWSGLAKKGAFGVIAQK